MKAEGLSGTRIAEELGLASTVVYRFLNPAYAQKQRDFVKKRLVERMATDPEFRERRRVMSRQSEKRSRLRRAAREEAELTGEPVEDVYARWGVSYRIPGHARSV